MTQVKTGDVLEKISSKYTFNVCPTCNGTGRIIYKQSCPEVYGDEMLLDFASDCPTCNGGLAERTETVKKSSNIPTAFYDKNYSSFNWHIYKDNSGAEIDLSNYQRIAESFLTEYRTWQKNGYGLYINSQTKGSGKTFLASCICNELMERYGIKTKFVSATQLLDVAKSGDDTSPDRYKREPIKLLCDCELLVIDDIGQKKTGADWLNEILFRITDERMTKKLVTIFTSNVKLNELSLDYRITSRIDKMTFSFSLPEYNVRQRESYDNKIKFMRKIGISKEGER